MQELFGFIIFVAIIAFIIWVIQTARKKHHPSVSLEDATQLKPIEAIPQSYHYERRDLVMTPTETEFFKMLDEAIGQNYYVFPQVHLSSLFEHRIHGQDWWKAFHHINRKSVDFVICDKQTVRPLAAIELDDWSHSLDKRKARDVEVERIFKGAGFPLLRFGNKGPYTAASIAESINGVGVLK